MCLAGIGSRATGDGQDGVAEGSIAPSIQHAAATAAAALVSVRRRSWRDAGTTLARWAARWWAGRCALRNEKGKEGGNWALGGWGVGGRGSFAKRAGRVFDNRQRWAVFAARLDDDDDDKRRPGLVESESLPTRVPKRFRPRRSSTDSVLTKRPTPMASSSPPASSSPAYWWTVDGKFIAGYGMASASHTSQARRRRRNEMCNARPVPAISLTTGGLHKVLVAAADAAARSPPSPTRLGRSSPPLPSPPPTPTLP